MRGGDSQRQLADVELVEPKTRMSDYTSDDDDDDAQGISRQRVGASSKYSTTGSSSSGASSSASSRPTSSDSTASSTGSRNAADATPAFDLPPVGGSCMQLFNTVAHEEPISHVHRFTLPSEDGGGSDQDCLITISLDDTDIYPNAYNVLLWRSREAFSADSEGPSYFHPTPLRGHKGQADAFDFIMKKPWKFYVGGDKSATVFDLSVDATHAASVLIENPDDDDENNVNDLVAFEDAAGEAYCCAGMEDGSVVIWSVADSFILDENGERYPFEDEDGRPTVRIELQRIMITENSANVQGLECSPDGKFLVGFAEDLVFEVVLSEDILHPDPADEPRDCIHVISSRDPDIASVLTIDAVFGQIILASGYSDGHVIVVNLSTFNAKDDKLGTGENVDADWSEVYMYDADLDSSAVTALLTIEHGPKASLVAGFTSGNVRVVDLATGHIHYSTNVNTYHQRNFSEPFGQNESIRLALEIEAMQVMSIEFSVLDTDEWAASRSVSVGACVDTDTAADSAPFLLHGTSTHGLWIWRPTQRYAPDLDPENIPYHENIPEKERNIALWKIFPFKSKNGVDYTDYFCDRDFFVHLTDTRGAVTTAANSDPSRSHIVAGTSYGGVMMWSRTSLFSSFGEGDDATNDMWLHERERKSTTDACHTVTSLPRVKFLAMFVLTTDFAFQAALPFAVNASFPATFLTMASYAKAVLLDSEILSLLLFDVGISLPALSIWWFCSIGVLFFVIIAYLQVRYGLLWTLDAGLSEAGEDFACSCCGSKTIDRFGELLFKAASGWIFICSMVIFIPITRTLLAATVDCRTGWALGSEVRLQPVANATDGTRPCFFTPEASGDLLGATMLSLCLLPSFVYFLSRVRALQGEVNDLGINWSLSNLLFFRLSPDDMQEPTSQNDHWLSQGISNFSRIYTLLQIVLVATSVMFSERPQFVSVTQLFLCFLIFLALVYYHPYFDPTVTCIRAAFTFFIIILNMIAVVYSFAEGNVLESDTPWIVLLLTGAILTPLLYWGLTFVVAGRPPPHIPSVAVTIRDEVQKLRSPVLSMKRSCVAELWSISKEMTSHPYFLDGRDLQDLSAGMPIDNRYALGALLQHCSHLDEAIALNCFSALRYLCGGDSVWEIVVSTLPSHEGKLLFDNVKQALETHGRNDEILLEIFKIFTVLTTLDADDDTDDSAKLETLMWEIVSDGRLVRHIVTELDRIFKADRTSEAGTVGKGKVKRGRMKARSSAHKSELGSTFSSRSSITSINSSVDSRSSSIVSPEFSRSNSRVSGNSSFLESSASTTTVERDRKRREEKNKMRARILIPASRLLWNLALDEARMNMLAKNDPRIADVVNRIIGALKRLQGRSKGVVLDQVTKVLTGLSECHFPERGDDLLQMSLEDADADSD